LSISSSEPAGEDDHRDQEDSLHYPQQKELEEKNLIGKKRKRKKNEWKNLEFVTRSTKKKS